MAELCRYFVWCHMVQYYREKRETLLSRGCVWYCTSSLFRFCGTQEGEGEREEALSSVVLYALCGWICIQFIAVNSPLSVVQARGTTLQKAHLESCSCLPFLAAIWVPVVGVAILQCGLCIQLVCSRLMIILLHANSGHHRTMRLMFLKDISSGSLYSTVFG